MPRSLVASPAFPIQSEFQVILEHFNDRKIYLPKGYVNYEPNRSKD